MYPNSIILMLSLCLPVFSYGQNIPLQKDYTGTTNYMAPQGWTISAQQQNGVYMWLATQNPNDTQSPSIMVMAMPNSAGNPKNVIEQVLQPYFASLSLEKQKLVSSDEGHLLLNGTSGNGTAKIAATFIRDAANGQMFVSCLAATPSDFQQLGAENLLYQCLNRPNPYSSPTSSTTTEITTPTTISSKNLVSDPVAEQFGAGVNMQSPEIQQQILRNSAQFTPKDLQGQWTQIMSTTTSNVYEEVGTGTLVYGSRGYGHLLKLKTNGQYELIYSYRSGPDNSADIVEKGNYQVEGNTLVLKSNGYNGTFKVYGKTQAQRNNQPGTHRFQLGMHASGKYLVLLGSPFEYTISSDTGPNGQPIFQEGFYRTQ